MSGRQLMRTDVQRVMCRCTTDYKVSFLLQVYTGMITSIRCFGDRTLTIRHIGIVLLLLIAINVLATSTWIIIKRSRQAEVTHWALSWSNATQLKAFPPPAHCPWLLDVTQRKRNYVPKPFDPPWVSLLASDSDTIASGKNLYLWACNSQRMRRFGNQLFNFAAVFGVAWRNRRIPLWTERYTHMAAFRHRLIIDTTGQRYVRNLQ